MFGRNKKKENDVFTHYALGDIKINPFIHTVESYKLTVFGKTHTVFLYVNSPHFKEEYEFTPNQEKAIDFFLNNISKIEIILENQLESFFKIGDCSAYKERLSLEDVSISNSGEIAVFFSSEFFDDELKEIDLGINFTDSFGIVVFPEERFLYNEEECYKFDT